jgi:hypothetical protein
MTNHPNRSTAAESRRRVSRVFATGAGGHNAAKRTYGFRITHPADGGKDRICEIGSYEDAVAARREALAEMIEALRALSST